MHVGDPLVWVLLVSSMTLCSCAPQVYDDPIPVMLNRDAGYAERRQAAAQAELEIPRDPRRIEALHKMLWEARYPPWQRQYAIDQLLEFDREFRAKLARRIVLFRNFETRNYIFDMAVQRGWTDFTPTLVRAYAQPIRGIADADRPERAAIQKLNPHRGLAQVVFEIFANADNGYNYRQQVAAWAILNRICATDTLLDMLHKAPASTSLVADLKATGADLQVLPRGREGVLWMAYLRDPARKRFWDTNKTIIANLREPQRIGLELRHLPVLFQADAQMLQMTRDELARLVEMQLQVVEHHYKGPTYDGPLTHHPQRMSHWRQKLVWADLLGIHLIQSLLKDRRMVETLFRQAEADRTDDTTEHGGVIDLTATGPQAIGYEPMARINKWKYVPSQTMIQHLYLSLAHYHFHAQAYRNSDHAGPGQGDLRMANNLRPNCVVFTFVSRDKLNVDYYQSGDVVIDMGTIYRN